ncbi:copper-binding protein [Caenimonas terrae]|uniref:Copper-binding protein n=1 Tax=Caenimonas terrae TaxID=696074 RepID=A0ABW0NLZ7_9BURK
MNDTTTRFAPQRRRLQWLAGAVLALGLLAAPAFAQGELTNGEVRKIDLENRKITLRHDPIKSLDMPAMTMVYQVPPELALDKLKVGDKVRFAAIEAAGKYTVTELQPAK